MGFSFYKTITVTGDSSKLASTQTDFPVLISVTDADLKSAGNGGHVQSASGYDIRPYADSPLTTALSFELEKYDPTTGQVVMWVKVPSCSLSAVFYLAYGNSALTADGSSNATWNSHFLAVYHLGDGTTLNANDATATGANGTLVNTPTAAAGKVHGCGSFASASSQYINLGTGLTLQPNAMTMSCWVKATSFPAAFNTVMGKNKVASPRTYSIIYVKSSNSKPSVYAKGPTALDDVSYDGSIALSTGTWYYLAWTYDSVSGAAGYVNAAVDGTHAASGLLDQNGSIETRIASDQGGGGNWNGLIDEVRISDVARSADWIKAEYHSMNDPSTFLTLGSEQAIAIQRAQAIIF